MPLLHIAVRSEPVPFADLPENLEMPLCDKLIALIEAHELGKVVGQHTMSDSAGGFDEFGDPLTYSALMLNVSNTESAIRELRRITSETELEGNLTFDFEGQEGADDDLNESIEVYYDIAAVPPTFEHPLDFRNAAMTLIEEAIVRANAGQWTGASSGETDLSFGFDVRDAALAEEIIRKAVEGTPFSDISEVIKSAEHPS